MDPMGNDVGETSFENPNPNRSKSADSSETPPVPPHPRLFTDAVGRCTERAHRQCWKLITSMEPFVDGCSSQIDLAFRRSYRFYHVLSCFIY